MTKNHDKKDPHAPLPGTEAEYTPIQRSAAESYLDKLGREMPSPLPVAPPIGYKRSPTLAEQIRAMVVSEKLKQEAISAGLETFEEADDFDVDDDYDPSSPYEVNFDPLPPPRPVAPAAPANPAGGSTAPTSPRDTPSGS